MNKVIFSLLLFTSTQSIAQQDLSILNKCIDLVDSSKNIEYKETDYIKNPSVEDTTIFSRKSIYQKREGNGNQYNIKLNIRSENGRYIGHQGSIIYIENKEIELNETDHLYSFRINNNYKDDISLINYLSIFKKAIVNSPQKIKILNDTIINNEACNHFIYTMYDSTIENKRLYHYLHLYVNKTSNLPNRIIFEGISKMSRDVYLIDYNNIIYSDYKFDNKFNFSDYVIPNNFNPEKEDSSTLTLMSPAPNWKLRSTDGKIKSLSDLKGKVVLIDFSFVGCGSCMSAIKTVNDLHTKFKNNKVEIVSIFYLSGVKSILQLPKNNNILYPIYIDENDKVANSYDVKSAPTFFFINKQGLIVKKIIGFEESIFEDEATSIITNLLIN